MEYKIKLYSQCIQNYKYKPIKRNKYLLLQMKPAFASERNV